MDDKKSLSLMQEEILIEHFKKYPILYDKSHKGHKEKNAVANCWSAISDGIDFIENGEMAKKYFHTFRKRYHKKRCAAKRDGKTDHTGNLNQPVGKATKDFEPYSFFKWYDQYARVRTSRCKSMKEDEQLNDEYYTTMEESFNNQSEMESDTEIKKEEIGQTAHDKLIEREEFHDDRSSDHDGGNRDIALYIKQRKGLYKDPDCEDLFASSIAAEIRKLPERLRCIAKHEINQVLFKYQIMMFPEEDSARPVVVLSDDFKSNTTSGDQCE